MSSSPNPNPKPTLIKEAPYPPKKCTTKLYRFLYFPTGNTVKLSSPCFQPTCKTCRTGMNSRWIEDKMSSSLPGDNGASISPSLPAAKSAVTPTPDLETYAPKSESGITHTHVGLEWRAHQNIQSSTSSTSTAHHQPDFEMTNTLLQNTTHKSQTRSRTRQNMRETRSTLFVHCHFHSKAGKQRFAGKIGEVVGRELLLSMLASYETGGEMRDEGMDAGVVPEAAKGDSFPPLSRLDTHEHEVGGDLTSSILDRGISGVQNSGDRGEWIDHGCKRKFCGAEEGMSDRKRPRMRHRIRLLFRSEEGKERFRDMVERWIL